MPFWRRKRSLHERLADEGGLELARDPREEEPDSGFRDPSEKLAWLAGGLFGVPTPTNRGHPLWDVVGIHGVARPREWDVVATADAPGVQGNELEFVALEDGTLYLDEGMKEEAVRPLAAAVEETLDGTYHAFAVRRDGDLWSVAATAVEVVEVPEDVPGDELQMTMNGEERSVVVAGRPHRAISSLEAFASERFADYVLQARRLDETLWEVELLPL